MNYKGSSTEDPEAVEQPEAEESNDRIAMTTNPADKCGNPESLCVMEVHSLRKMPSGLGKQKTDVTVRLPINYKLQTTDIVGERLTFLRFPIFYIFYISFEHRKERSKDGRIIGVEFNRF